MKCYLDTDALSKLIQRLPGASLELLPRNVIIVTSDLAIEELIVTSDSTRRVQLAQGMLSLIENGAIVLSHMNHQIDWAVEDFLAGSTVFTPYEIYNRKGVCTLLRNSSSLPPSLWDRIAGKREAENLGWDEMHKQGRPGLQRVLASGADLPSAGDWVSMIGGSSFASDLLRDVVSSGHAEALKGREQSYVQWNPICRCYIEQFLLAIRRYGIEPPNVSSKKGPKWADYFHGAFVGVVDSFVTNDKRFRRALSQHREVRGGSRWEIFELSDFLGRVQSGSYQGETEVNRDARWGVPQVAKRHDH